MQLYRYWKKFIIPVEEMLADICKHGFKIDAELFHKNKAFIMEQAALLHHELLAEIPHSILHKHHEKYSSLRKKLYLKKRLNRLINNKK